MGRAGRRMEGTDLAECVEIFSDLKKMKAKTKF
jgi:hypothetical protein